MLEEALFPRKLSYHFYIFYLENFYCVCENFCRFILFGSESGSSSESYRIRILNNIL